MFETLAYCITLVIISMAVVYGIISMGTYIEKKTNKNDKYSLGTSHKEWL